MTTWRNTYSRGVMKMRLRRLLKPYRINRLAFLLKPYTVTRPEPSREKVKVAQR